LSAPKHVLIVMGSDSDLPVLKEAKETLEALCVGSEIRVVSAHRTPERALELFSGAEAAGFRAIIAGAGGAAHLAGFAAAHTVLPVIGIPIASGALNGVDALYATVQMPPGVPVATVAINGGRNAGLLAAEILAVADPKLRKALKEERRKVAEAVEEKDRMVREGKV